MLNSAQAKESTSKSPLPQQLNLLDSIIQSSYDGIFVADATGVGWTMNEAYTRITGVSKSELLYRDLKDAIKEGIISDSVTYRVLEEKRAITIVQNVNGVEVLATGSPVTDDEGKITHVVTNIRDLRDLNYLKSELNASRAFTDNLLKEFSQRSGEEEINPHLKGMITRSKEIRKALSIAKKVAKVDSTVILTGESGVGKEVFADFIHDHSRRKGKAYIKVNCAAIPAALLESELFGYEKGAFTGAVNNGKTGLFEEANGGTIFLDEIGEIQFELQVKLLRVLQELEIKRVGGTRQIPLDIRIITATNQRLEKLVEQGKFREDLYYRLNVVPIDIAPLRERTSDIASLANHFLKRLNQKYDMNKTLHPEVLPVLENYSWPGNIRELENVIERVAVTCDQDEIVPSELAILNKDKASNSSKSSENKSLKEQVYRLEVDMIQIALKKHLTTRKAADSLGISQSTLVKKMKRFHLSSQEYVHD
ncbi:sigma-54 interaction domain-containing protein [Halobacillus amylolyticus]|uniref:HTH-type transcriptional regulatory protein TyrR n=1 Tax=Halobacillus amylolyticus TaxID=2932259 RepID=A0ABY4HFZ3_9BACI|nr:sigma 54-interacting transcriptional regulator [Halobacillus amylolyticus]UOR13822.1 sigma 54-interacting transcriptional regulator [Halobacillus amylolyticus]